MKKIIIAVICAAFVMFGCDKDPVTPANQNDLVGTTWVHGVQSPFVDNYSLCIYFNESTFDLYKADPNGNYIMSYSTVRYTKSGNKITFPRTYVGAWNAYFTGTGTISGNRLTLDEESYGSMTTTVFMKK